MTPLAWVFGMLCLSAISAFLVFRVMKAHLDAAQSAQQAALAEAQASLAAAHERALEHALKSTEESARRKALDEFLADLHVEERHYVREQKVLFVTRRSLVRQERIFFRNIPLSNWVENEMTFEEGADLKKLAETMAVFSPEMLSPPKPGENRINRLRA